MAPHILRCRVKFVFLISDKINTSVAAYKKHLVPDAGFNERKCTMYYVWLLIKNFALAIMNH